MCFPARVPQAVIGASEDCGCIPLRNIYDYVLLCRFFFLAYRYRIELNFSFGTLDIGYRTRTRIELDFDSHDTDKRKKKMHIFLYDLLLYSYEVVLISREKMNVRTGLFRF